MRLRGFAILVCLLLLSSCAFAQELRVSVVSTEMGQGYVHYPQLEGMADETVQQKINDDIVLASGIPGYLVTLATLNAGAQQTLRVDCRAAVVNGEVFSAVLSARGKLPGTRDGQRYTALCYDMQTGERMTLADVLEDVPGAVAQMEALIVASLSDELNGYLEYGELTPLPVDSFTLDEAGITFWYPSEQFCWLSGYAGAAQFWYEEVDGWRLDVPEADKAADARESILEAVAAGEMPRIPAHMGQPVTELTETYRLLREPDAFPGGRYYVLEDPAFRDVLVISDTLDAKTAGSVVEGLQLRRGSLYGLAVGRTERGKWLELLGAPEKTVALTPGMAYDYSLPEGRYDVYHSGDNELRLYMDTQDVLSAIQLCK